MIKTWVVALDRSQARIFERHGVSSLFEEVYTVENPDGRKQAKEIIPGRSGPESSAPRNVDRWSRGNGDNSGLHSPKERLLTDLCTQVAQHLRDAALRDEFDKLVILAEPHNLGVLRGELSHEVKWKIVAEIAKEYREDQSTQLADLLRTAIPFEDKLHPVRP